MPLQTYGFPGLVLVAAPGAGAVDEGYLEFQLQRATDIINSTPGLKDLRQRIQADAELQERVDRVAAAMVARVILNPENVRSRTSTKGPFSESVTYADANAEMALTDTERASLLATATVAAGRRRIGSIRLAPRW